MANNFLATANRVAAHLGKAPKDFTKEDIIRVVQDFNIRIPGIMGQPFFIIRKHFLSITICNPNSYFFFFGHPHFSNLNLLKNKRPPQAATGFFFAAAFLAYAIAASLTQAPFS